MSVYIYTCHMSITEVAFSDLSLVETGDKQHSLTGELIPMTMVAHICPSVFRSNIHTFFLINHNKLEIHKSSNYLNYLPLLKIQI